MGNRKKGDEEEMRWIPRLKGSRPSTSRLVVPEFIKVTCREFLLVLEVGEKDDELWSIHRNFIAREGFVVRTLSYPDPFRPPVNHHLNATLARRF